MKRCASLENLWYQPSLNFFTRSLLPLSWLFHGAVAVRRLLYRTHCKKTENFPVPVIVVGNITVGGTGKTPFVIWLANFLKTQGYHPGIVTRGVGGAKQINPRIISADVRPAEVGDEAILLAQRTDCPVVVCVRRPAAVQTLLSHHLCDVVISDDGLQHYRLGRDIEIVLVDSVRQFGNKQLLPAGPLRESVKRLNEVDFVVHNGKSQVGGFSMILQQQALCALIDNNKKTLLHDFCGKTVHAVAGIGHPARFFNALREQGLHVIEHVFADHYLYQKQDVNFPDHLPIIMTEKDAVKCQAFADERFWCLPVEASLETEFTAKLLKKLQEKTHARHR